MRARSRATPRLALSLVSGSAGALLAPAAAHACAVCYGAAADPMIDGTRWSVVFMLLLTYLLLGGGALLFVLARRSARRRAGHGAAGTTAPAVTDDLRIPQASTRGLV